MIHKRMEDALNEQVAAELASAQLYLSISPNGSFPRSRSLTERLSGKFDNQSSATCTSCLPRFFPLSMLMNAMGALSIPRTMSS
jgi:hypothetical protein